ncbi:MAG: adhesin, partial [Alphaproteobacteria bacterium]|nr:adhesin [Alphaproteobacteria bacterium]
MTSNYNGAEISCAGSCDGEATVGGSGGTGIFTFAWDAQTGNQTTPIATGLCANTTYSVTVTDNTGCFGIATVTLSEPSALTSTVAGTDASCRGVANGSATATSTGGTGSYQFNWSDGQTDATATGLAAGQYTVTTTDINGCTVTAQVTISEPATALLVSVTEDTLYNGAQLTCAGNCDGALTSTVSGGTAAYSYLWSNGATTASI